MIYSYVLMKIKDWFKTLLVGVGIGVGSAIPGVSGGTIAVIFKVYEKIVWAISNILNEFKKAIIILIPILLGVVIGLIPTIILMHEALQGFVFGVICIFAGFITGSIPKINDEVKGVKPTTKAILLMVGAGLLAIGLGLASIFAKTDVSVYFATPKWWFYLILIPVGLIASTALVVPGISGSMLLILLGFYKPLIDSTVEVAKECIAGNWAHFGMQFGLLACFAIGVIIGFVLISKLMNYLLNKFHHETFFGILGFVIGSDIALFLNFEIWEYYLKWSNGVIMSLKKEVEIPLGIALFVVITILSYLFVRYQRKIEKEQQAEQN